MKDKCLLKDCPIGLFLSENKELCLKTEYGTNEGQIAAYIVSTGEMFWGREPQTIQGQRNELVQPVNIQEILGEIYESLKDSVNEIERLTKKWGDPNGNQYEQGVWDHGMARCLPKAKEPLMMVEKWGYLLWSRFETDLGE